MSEDSDKSIEMFRSLIDSAKDALRASMIINGGAVLALLSLLGNIDNSNLKNISSDLSQAMGIFALGVLSTSIAYGLRYIAQFSYAHKKTNLGHILKIITIAAVLSAHIAFFTGVWITYEAFSEKI